MPVVGRRIFGPAPGGGVARQRMPTLKKDRVPSRKHAIPGNHCLIFSVLLDYNWSQDNRRTTRFQQEKAIDTDSELDKNSELILLKLK